MERELGMSRTALLGNYADSKALQWVNKCADKLCRLLDDWQVSYSKPYIKVRLISWQLVCFISYSAICIPLFLINTPKGEGDNAYYLWVLFNTYTYIDGL